MKCPGQRMLELKVDGMSCQHCVRAVSAAIRQLDGAAKVEVDLAAGLLRTDAKAEAEAIRAVLRAAGYEPAPG